jgi:two-component system cell cycle sensor histidine kinase/response regulator CckA
MDNPKREVRAGLKASLPALILTILTAAVIELVRLAGADIVSPGAILVSVVALGAFYGGVIAGLLSAGLSLGYITYFVTAGVPAGTLAGDDVRRLIAWSIGMPVLALLVGQMGRRAKRAIALVERLQRTREQLHTSETGRARDAELKASLLDGLAAEVALLDQAGRIVSVNRAWHEAAERTGAAALRPGASYPGSLTATVPALARGASAVLAGSIDSFEGEFQLGPAGAWHRVSINGVELGDGRGAVAMHLDITHHRLTEDELRESRGLLEQAQRVASIGSWVYHPATGGLQWSAETHRIFGITPEEFDGRFETFNRCVHPDDSAAVAQATSLALEHGEPYAIDHRIVRPDGEVRWVHERAVVERGAGEKPRMVGVVQDITERKLAQDALHASEQRYRRLFELNPQPKWVFDQATHRFLAVNRAALQAYGYSLAEFLAMTVDQIRHPEDRARFRDEVEVAGGIVQRDGWRHVLKSGETIEVEITSDHLNFEGHDAIIEVALNVTERRRSERLLAGQNLVLGLLAGGSPIKEALSVLIKTIEGFEPQLRGAVFTLDPGGQVLHPLAAPSLPEAFLRAAEMTPVGPACGASGTAVHRRERVIIQDMSADPLSRSTCQKAAELGLSAGWAQPILGSAGAPLGVLTLYHSAPRAPTRPQIKLLESAAYLAGLGIERNRAEAELKEREAMLRLQFEQMPSACILIDSQRRVTQWNPAAERIFGFSPAEALGRDILDFLVLGEDAATVREAVDAAFAGGAPSVRRNRNRTRDRGPIVCEWQNVPIRDASGAVIGVMALAQDITQRLAADEALRRSEELNRRIIEHMPGGLVQVDMSGAIVKANTQAQRVLGLTVDELTRRTVRDFATETIYEDGRPCPPEDYPVSRALATGRDQPAMTIGVRRADGHTSWGVYTAIPIFESGTGRQSGALVTFVDITERKAYEERLARSEERYRRLAEHGAVGIWEVRPDGQTVYANPAMCRILDVPSPEALAGLTWQEFFDESSLRIVEREHRRRFEGLASAYEVQITTRRGAKRRVMISGAPAVNPQLKLETFLGTITDITELKNAEEALRQAQKLDAVGRLASGVAHDFNNLLTAIFGFTALARRSLPPDHAAAQALDRIDEAATQAGGITKGLLTFTREEPAQRKPVILGKIVTDAAALLRRTLPADVDLRVSVDPDRPVWVLADTTQLHQVIMNLAINARDAMPGGGLLTLAVDCVDTAGDHSSYARLTVTDTGAGMTPEVRDRVFDPFFTTKPIGEGTGLGLPITMGIVREHGGRIEVETELGRGTTFRILLPLGAPAAETEPRPANRPIPGGRGELVLLADDHTYVREIMASMLQSLGYRVLQAGDALSLLELFENNIDTVRVIAVDAELPGGGGQECLRRVHAKREMLPTILMSPAHDQNANNGDDPTYVLGKPFQMNELADAVAAALARTGVSSLHRHQG